MADPGEHVTVTHPPGPDGDEAGGRVDESVDAETTAEEPDERADAEAPDERADEKPSLSDLLGELGRDLTALAVAEGQLEASRHMPEVRRAARDVAGAVVAGLAFTTAFAFANVAAVLGLSEVWRAWLAALAVAGTWAVLGAVLAVLLAVRAARVSGWKWWRVFGTGAATDERGLERSRDEAADAVLGTLERLAPVITLEIASAAVPLAGGIAGSVGDVGESILEGSDDLVEAIAEELPGGGVVNQVWDVVLMPGRFGLRVATTVFKRSPDKG